MQLTSSQLDILKSIATRGRVAKSYTNAMVLFSLHNLEGPSLFKSRTTGTNIEIYSLTDAGTAALEEAA